MPRIPKDFIEVISICSVLHVQYPGNVLAFIYLK